MTFIRLLACRSIKWSRAAERDRRRCTWLLTGSARRRRQTCGSTTKSTVTLKSRRLRCAIWWYPCPSKAPSLPCRPNRRAHGALLREPEKERVLVDILDRVPFSPDSLVDYLWYSNSAWKRSSLSRLIARRDNQMPSFKGTWIDWTETFFKRQVKISHYLDEIMLLACSRESFNKRSREREGK